MLISPLDWALVESWKSAGVPLHIVLRAINESFDAYDKRPHNYRKVNSIFYCQQAVESNFAEHRLSQVGGTPPVEQPASSDSDKPASKPSRAKAAFPKEIILEFLARCNAGLSAALSDATRASRAETVSAIHRALARMKEIIAEVERSERVNSEGLERDLDAVDRMILESVVRDCGDEAIQKVRAEAESQLRPYRKKMDKAMYEQTVQNFIARRLHEINNIPRLSLFYI